MMVATILTSTTQPLSDILPWGTPISVSSSSSSADSSDIVTSNSRKCTTNERTLLITDAIANDGRFILNTLALQYLSSRHTISSNNDLNNNNSNTTTLEGAVLWLSCSSTAEKEIMLGLRKGMQHNLAGVGSNNNGSGRIHTVSIPIELADVVLSATEQSSAESGAVSHEVYLKQLHKRIVHWLKYRELLPATQQQEQQISKDSNTQLTSSQGPNLIVIDNATTLATMFGNRLASAFVSSVQSSLKKYSKISSSSSDNSSTSSVTTCTNLLAIRASSPDDGGLYQLDTDDSLKGEKLRSEYARLLRPWLGLGSGSSDANQVDTNILQIEEQSNYSSLIPQSIPSFVYTSGLYELVDCIVDVSPLESGYARDVLGRLSFVTTWNGKGWWGIPSGGNNNAKNKKDTVDGAHASLCINYRCDDSGVRVMRLRT